MDDELIIDIPPGHGKRDPITAMAEAAEVEAHGNLEALIFDHVKATGEWPKYAWVEFTTGISEAGDITLAFTPKIADEAPKGRRRVVYLVAEYFDTSEVKWWAS